MSSYRTILSLIIFFSFGSADGYNLVDDYTVSNFFDMFTFYTGGDPTNGHVQYVNRNTASTNGYISTNPSSVYMGVDHAGLYPRGGPGRPSVRLISNHVYTHGLFILDLSHMPTGCGTWPAFWTLGPNWPTNGEIDIIEGVNLDQVNHMTLHSTPNCTIAGSGMIGRLETNNCAYYPGHNVGCGISAPPASNSYGDPFNLNGGGVYATEWTSANIKVWFFPRGSVPDTIVNSDASPDITQFGLPTAIFQGSCNFDEKFANHQIILNTDFCGDYAGNAYSSSSCPLTQGFSSWDSCVTFVGNNPQNFTEAYWSINSLRVYQNDAIVPSSSLPPVSSVTPAASTGSANVGPGMGNTGTTASSSLSLATTSTVPPPAQSTASCPSMNMTQFTSASGAVYLIECDINHSAGDLPAPNGLRADTFTACINQCDARSGCVDLTWVSGGGACFLKGSVGPARAQPGNFGARLVTPGSVPPSSSTRYSTPPLTSVQQSSSSIPAVVISSSGQSPPPVSNLVSTSTTSSTAHQSPSGSVVPLCPASNQTVYTNSNGTQWFVECGIGRAGCNITPTGLTAATLQICIDRCANRLGCIEVIWAGGMCYEKSCVGTKSFNIANNGAYLLSNTVAISSQLASPSSGLASSSSPVGPESSTSAWLSPSLVITPILSSGLQSTTQASSSQTTSSATPGSSSVTCPAFNQTEYVTVNGTYHIDCGINYSSGNMPLTGQTAPSFQACVDRCAMTVDCKGAVYFNGACFLKAFIGAMSVNAANNAARLIIAPVSSVPPAATASLPSSSTLISVPSASVSPTSANIPGSTSSASPSATPYTCPASNSTIYHNTNGTNFVIECSLDTSQGTIASPVIQTFEGCMDACANQVNCIRVSWQPGPKNCYMKSSIGASSINVGIWGARVLQVQTSSSLIAISSATPTATIGSSAAASNTPLSATVTSVAVPSSIPIMCPAANQTTYTNMNGTFLIDCFIGYAGGNVAGIGQTAATMELCLDRCSSTPTCTAVNWQFGPKNCYLKSSVGASSSNPGIYGARLLPHSTSLPAVVSSTPLSTGTSVPFQIPMSSSAFGSGIRSSAPSSSPSMSGSSSLLTSSVVNTFPSTSNLVLSSTTVHASTSRAGTSPFSFATGTALISFGTSSSSQGQGSGLASQSPPVSSTITLPSSQAAGQSTSQYQTPIGPSISVGTLSVTSASVLSQSTSSPQSPGGPSTSIATVSVSSQVSAVPLSFMSTGAPSSFSSRSVGPSNSQQSGSSSISAAMPAGSSDVSLNTSSTTPNVEVKYDPATNITYVEMEMDSLTMMGSITIPINGTSTTQPQTIKFALKNSGNYFGKKLKRVIEQRQSYTGCILTVYYGGVSIYTVDIADLGSDYQTYTSDSIVPGQTNTTLQFVETCQNTAIFPTVDIANITIITAGAATSSSITMPLTSNSSPSFSSSISVSLSPSSSAGPGSISSTLAPPPVSISSSSSVPTGSLLSTLGSSSISSLISGLSSQSSSSQIGPASSVLGSITSIISGTTVLPTSSTGVSTPSVSSVPSTSTCLQCSVSRSTITLTHSTCAHRSRITKTIWSTATVTTCADPLVCPNTSGNLGTITGSQSSLSSSSRTSLTSPPGSSSSACAHTLYGSLCYTCGLTPTLISTTCNPGTSSSSSAPSSTTAGTGSSDAPLCPYETPGRLYADFLGGIYSIYCGLEYTDAILGQAIRQDTFGHCISACDAYNTVHFNEGSPCRGVSYYESTMGDNCFLKTGVLGPVARLGVDSAKLMNPQLPADNSTTSIVMVTTTASFTVTGPGGGPGTGPGATVTIGSGTGPGGGPGIGPGATITVGSVTGPGGGGPGTGPGGVTVTVGSNTGPGGGPGTGPGVTVTVGSGTGPGGGPGTGPGLPTTVYSTIVQTTTFVSISTTTSVSLSISTRVSTLTSIVTSVTTAITTVSGTPTTITSSVPVPTTIISSVPFTQSITLVSSIPVTITSVGTQFVTVPPVTVTEPGSGGGVVTVTATVSSKSSSFVCHPTPMNYLMKRKRRLLDPSLHIEAVRDLEAMHLR